MVHVAGTPHAQSTEGVRGRVDLRFRRARHGATLARRTREKIRVPEFQAGHEVLDAFGEPTKTLEVVYKWLPRDEVPKETLKWFIELQREAMEETAPGIVEAMRFIKSLPMPLRWASPSGVPVLNLERKTKASALTLWRGSEPSRNGGAVGYEPEMDEGETRARGGAEFYSQHGRRAPGLRGAGLRAGGVPLLTVHDFFATLPCHADKLREILLR